MQKYKFFNYIKARTRYIRWWCLLCTRQIRKIGFLEW